MKRSVIWLLAPDSDVFWGKCILDCIQRFESPIIPPHIIPGVFEFMLPEDREMSLASIRDTTTAPDLTAVYLDGVELVNLTEDIKEVSFRGFLGGNGVPSYDIDIIPLEDDSWEACCYELNVYGKGYSIIESYKNLKYNYRKLGYEL